MYQSTNPKVIQLLDGIKRPGSGITPDDQAKIMTGMIEWFTVQDPKWSYEIRRDIARYITLGLTEVEQLHNALKFTDEEVAPIWDTVNINLTCVRPLEIDS